MRTFDHIRTFNYTVTFLFGCMYIDSRYSKNICSLYFIEVCKYVDAACTVSYGHYIHIFTYWIHGIPSPAVSSMEVPWFPEMELPFPSICGFFTDQLLESSINKETQIFPWFSHGFPMVFMGFSCIFSLTQVH